MHREDIKAALRKGGDSLSDIARDLGVSPSAVARCLSRPTSKRIEQEIARRLGKPAEKLWPDRYSVGAGASLKRSHQQ